MSRPVNPWKVTGYKAGQNVVCKVSHAEPGGYAVIIPKDNLPGFLPTETTLKPGEEVLAQYVCVSNSRILLQCRFGTNTKSGAVKHQTVNWEEQLDQLDNRQSEKIDYQRPSAQQEYAQTDPQPDYQEPYQQPYQEPSYAQEFDQEPGSDQVSYTQEPYSSGQYAQNYAETQEQYDQSQVAQGQGFGYSQPDPASYQYEQPGQYQYGAPSGGFQPVPVPAPAPGGMSNQAGVAGPPWAPPWQADYSQSQSMQFNPAGPQQGNAEPSPFATPQNTNMQFKPQLPADYVDVQNQWTSHASLPPMPPSQQSAGAPPEFTPQQPQNPYQAPMQASAPYSQAQSPAPMQAAPPPVSYQSQGQALPAASYQAPAQAAAPAGYPMPPQAGQYQTPGAHQNQYNSGSQAAPSPTAYQSPGSYQGPAQTASAPVTGAPPQQAPAPSAAQPPGPASYSAPFPEIDGAGAVANAAPPVTPAQEEQPADAWGYAGQGWDDGSRLTAAPAAELVTPVPPAIPAIPAMPTAPAVAPASEADAAFQVWAPKVPAREFHLKRATDLVPPAFDLSSLATFTAEEQDLEWLITDIEGGMRTGCVKAISQSAMSRSAALLYKGRAVGCIYGRKKQAENYGTEQSLQIMMQDLEKPDTQIQLYDLPETVVLPMSALFLGYPVPREENVDARTYMDYMCNWFASKTQTACLAITFPSRSATCLCFIHDGKFCGAFYVEEQKFTSDKEFVYALMQSDPGASVEASILPPEMTSSAVRFGFNLSMARKKGF